MTRSRLLSLSILSGLLLVPAWYEAGTGLILLFAFIPLLFLEDYFFENKSEHRPHKAFLYAIITFFTWNLAATWWLWNATPAGMFAAIIINTSLMSLTFWLVHITRRNTSSGMGHFAFITYWLAYEHFYTYAEVNWPWLNLGNGFANDILFIQWYEFTGAFGGTFWILLVNVLGFHLLKHFILHRTLNGKLIQASILAGVVLFPIGYSLIRFSSYQEKNDPKEIVVIQPNIDPYGAKFGGMEMERQMEILLHLVPALMLMNKSKRTDRTYLFRASLMIVFGGALYRFSAYWFAFNPGDHWSYFPAIPEILITVGLVAFEIAAYITIIKRFPILTGAPPATAKA